MEQKRFVALSPHGFHRVAYTEWGKPDAARTVICVHGLTRNGRDFDTLAGALSDEYRVICPDMPGRGLSDKLADPCDYQYPTYLQTCATLLAHLGVERVDWIGTSMGGLIGMMLAAQPNSPLRRLMLNDVGAEIPGAALERIAGYVQHTGPFSTLRDVETRLRSIHSGFGDLTDDQWQHMARHSHWRAGDGRFWLAYDPAIAQSLTSETYPDVNLWPVWNAVTCRTLILRGDKSDVLPASVADAMVASRPDSRILTFPDLGHAPALMSDDQVTPIKSWLRGSNEQD